MFDLKLINAVDSLPVTSADIESLYPLVVVLTGHNFDFAAQVVLNYVTIPSGPDVDGIADTTGSFQIISPDTIRVVCPKSLWSKRLERIFVLGEDVVQLNEITQLSFGFNNFKPVGGMTKVMQHFCKLLRTTPGSDFFEPDQGGGLQEFVGMTLDRTNAQGFIAKLHLAIRRCADDIKKSQRGREWKLPPDEILLDVIPVDVGFDAEALSISVILNVQTAARQAVVKMGV